MNIELDIALQKRDALMEHLEAAGLTGPPLQVYIKVRKSTGNLVFKRGKETLVEAQTVEYALGYVHGLLDGLRAARGEL